MKKIPKNIFFSQNDSFSKILIFWIFDDFFDFLESKKNSSIFLLVKISYDIVSILTFSATREASKQSFQTQLLFFPQIWTLKHVSWWHPLSSLPRAVHATVFSPHRLATKMLRTVHVRQIINSDKTLRHKATASAKTCLPILRAWLA